MVFRRSAANRSRAIAAPLAIALCSGVLLAACAPTGEDPQPLADEVPGVAPAPTAADEGTADATMPASAAGGTVGGDGSEITLEALTRREVERADLAGELACNFSTDDDRPILHATGVVASEEPARGIVKVGSYVEEIRAPGGFDGMTKNPTFTGQGKTIRIVETGPAIGGGESPPRPATLTYQRADGASRTFEGRWQCGP